MPDARGDVLCPTCGQWTPPAPFCTECGAALQGDFRDAVGGQGSDVFRRGREVDQPGAPWSAPGERFEPEPEDEAARAAAAARAAGGAPVDHFTEPEPEAPAPAPPWPAEPGLAAGNAPPADRFGADETSTTETPSSAPAAAAAAGTAAGAAATGAAARRRVQAAATPPVDKPAPQPPPAPPPVVPPPSSPPPPPRTYAAADSNGGVSGLVFVLFLGLGILALLGGAIIGGVFDGGPAAEGSPSPTATIEESEEPTPEPSSAAPTPSPSVAPTAPPASSSPGEFPDGFIARAETCDEQPSSSTCDNSGAVNDGELWVLVSFRHAKPTDVIGVSIIDSGGKVDGESSLELNFCGDNTDCAGYTFFGFNNLAPGGYTVRVTRNGTFAATTSFTVE